MKTISEDIDFLKFVGTQESQYLEKASAFTEEVLARLNGDQSLMGELLPWSKSHRCVALRPGEVSIWGGYNGHGKSQLLGQVCAWGLKESKWLIASLEMKPAATMYRMTRQITRRRDASPDYVKKFLTWTDDKLWIYDQLDTVKAERILGMVHYAAQELGINHIVIDSLMKCGIGTDDYNSQKDFIDRLCWAAKSENIHIHLVHHMRKGQNEYSPPDKHDFRGAGELTDLVDNVFIVHRNKGKEDKVRNNELVDEGEADCTLRIAKQRHGEWEGAFKFWFHGDSMQYVSQPDKGSMKYDF